MLVMLKAVPSALQKVQVSESPTVGDQPRLKGQEFVLSHSGKTSMPLQKQKTFHRVHRYVAILSMYWTGGDDQILPNTSNHEILRNWAKIAYSSTLFTLFKSRDAVPMIQCFKDLQNSADLLSPLRNKMSIGMVSKQACSTAGKETIDCQDKLMTSIGKRNIFCKHFWGTALP